LSVNQVHIEKSGGRVVVDEQPSVGDVGSVDFDAADRLAIINLLGAYAHTYDANRLDDFRALFTESPELVLTHGNGVISGGIDTPRRRFGW
jgi:hypothetical protein